MFESDHPLARLLWPIMAAFAGAITALSFRPFKRMTAGEIVMALVVGTAFATFVGPLAAHWAFGEETHADMQKVGALFYLLASGSNILIPWCIRRAAALMGIEPKEKP